MADNLYRCPACQAETTAIFTAATGWQKPVCVDCACQMEWIPNGVHHVGNLGWTVDLGADGVHTVNSITDANRLEAESRRRAANGEGQEIVLRAFHQNPSNMDHYAMPVVEDTRRAQLAAAQSRSVRGIPLHATAAPCPSDALD